MKKNNWKLVGLIALVAVILCTAAYAGKHKEVTLPDLVKAAIAKLYPQAAIEEVKKEKEGIEVYEVELKQNEKEVELTFAPDGTLVETEAEIAVEGLPKNVADAIGAAVPGAKIDEVSQETNYAVVKLVPLDAPKTTYEAKLVKDGNEIEIKLAADGTVLEQKSKDKDDDKDDNDKDD